MGEISVLTKEQEFFLGKIAKSEYIRSNFYFTGGTALSHFYLQHRFSVDLDFFSEKKFDNQIIFNIVANLGKNSQFSSTSRFIETVYIFEITFKNKKKLRVDFGHYPYPRLEKGILYQGLKVDSLRDIAANKLLTVNQRTDVKDFVDLYFLLQKEFTIWDLIYSVRAKFKTEGEPVLLASDFLKAQDFEFLPRMIKPVSLPELKKFFREQAIAVGKRAVTP